MRRISGYPVSFYVELACEPNRMAAYAEALRRAMTPGCAVLDLGTGIGVTAVLACRLGAGRVFAVETDASIHIARALAAENGCADRITFFHGRSMDFEPPAKADVIVSDLHGVLPFWEHHVPTLVDARARLLAPGGALIPARDTIRAALVEDPALHGRVVGPEETGPFGIRLGAARRHAANGSRRVFLEPDRLLSEAGTLGVLDYHSVEDPDFRGEVELAAARDGVLHGIVVWWDSDFAEGVPLSNAPFGPGGLYGQMFHPFTEPIPLRAGDRARVRFRAGFAEGLYAFGWGVEVRPRGSGPDAAPVARRSHSGAGASPIDPAEVLRLRPDHRPSLSREGAAERWILDRLDGTASTGEVAAQARAAFPDLFEDEAAALSHLRGMLRRGLGA